MDSPQWKNIDEIFLEFVTQSRTLQENLKLPTDLYHQ